MALYTEKPEIVEAIQWLKTGDHGDVSTGSAGSAAPCKICGFPLNTHGEHKFISSNPSIICPGTWQIKHRDGRLEYLDDKTFQERYELIKE